jgi:hypothetical protein
VKDLWSSRVLEMVERRELCFLWNQTSTLTFIRYSVSLPLVPPSAFAIITLIGIMQNAASRGEGGLRWRNAQRSVR